ncbi:hypothetical protein OG345_04815 [Streptomyces sp. NBC_01220]|nr:hypothetical protein OG345_04815 [Streptomyces sp. NBC_01220]
MVVEGVEDAGSGSGGGEEAGLSQDLEVVGDRRLAELEVVDDDARWYRAFLPADETHDENACRVGEGLEPAGVLLGGCPPE